MVDLVNKSVKHISLGIGTVVSQDENYINVQFATKTCKFGYPSAFEKFLSIDPESEQAIIQAEVEEQKNREREEKEALARRANAKTLSDLNSVGEYYRSKKKKEFARKNVALKCNFNDGGKNDERIGFNGVCSDKMIRNNITVEKRNWCTKPECSCLQYFNGEITRAEIDAFCENDGWVCYESQMLRNWKAMAGAYTSGEKKGEPMKLRNVQRNSLAVLTTRTPGSKESDRFIFAMFLVDDFNEGDDAEEGYVSTKSIYKLSFTEKECKKLLFWNYHANSSDPASPAWASGLFRYITDDEAVQMLRDAVLVKKGTKDESLAAEFLEYFCQINGIDMHSVDSPAGALLQK